MADFTEETKHDSSFTEEDRHDSTFVEESLSNPPAKFGKAKFGKSRFGTVKDVTPFVNEEREQT